MVITFVCALIAATSSDPLASAPPILELRGPSSYAQADEAVSGLGRVVSQESGRVFLVAPNRSSQVDALRKRLKDHGLQVAEVPANPRAKVVLPTPSNGLTQMPSYKDYIRSYLAVSTFPTGIYDREAFQRELLRAQKMPSGAARIRAMQRERRAPAGRWTYLGPTNLYPDAQRIFYGDTYVNGRIMAAAYAPDMSYLLCAGVEGGVMKSFNGGITWRPMSNQWMSLQTSCLAIKPDDKDVILAGTGDTHSFFTVGQGIMRSEDGGLNWTPVAPGSNSAAIPDIVFDPDNPERAFAVAGSDSPPTGGRGRLSTDGGKTWAPRGPTGRSYDLEVGPANAGGGRTWYWAIATGGAHRIYRSNDSGDTWTQTAFTTDGAGVLDLASSPDTPGRVYALQSAMPGKVHISNDFGNTWTEMPSAGITWGQTNFNFFIHCAKAGGTDAVFVGQVALFVTTDGGATWTGAGALATSGDALYHADQHAMTTHPWFSNEVLLGNDGGLYRLTYLEGNGVWQVQGLNDDLAASTFVRAAFHPTDRNIIVGGTQDNGAPAAVAHHGVDRWSMVIGGDGGGAQIHSGVPNRQYASSQGPQIVRTADGWITQGLLVDPAIFAGEVSDLAGAPIVRDPQNPDRFYTSTNFLHRFDDNGAVTWTARLGGMPLTPAGTIRAIAVAHTDSQVIYTGSDAGVLQMSTDGGMTWRQIQTGSPSLPLRGITSLSVSPTSPFDVLVGLGGFGNVDGNLWRCTDTSQLSPSWTPMSGTTPTSQLPAVNLWAIARDPFDMQATEIWYVGTEIGVFVTFDGGTTWSDVTRSMGLPPARVTVLEIVPQTGYLMAATYGRGVWSLPIGFPSNRIKNGDFEAPSVPRFDQVTFSSGEALGDWTVGLGQARLINDLFTPASGMQAVVIGESGMGSIYQDIQTELGATYQLEFRAAATPWSGTAQVSVYWDDALVGTIEVDPSNGPRRMRWKAGYFAVSATANSHRVTCLHVNVPPQGIAIDNFRVTKTEPRPQLDALLNLDGATMTPFGFPIDIRPVDSTSVITTTAGYLNGPPSNATMSAWLPMYGQYNVSLKPYSYLRKSFNVDVKDEPVRFFGSLVNGDVSGDNTINIQDFLQLRLAFGSTPGSANWNQKADLDFSLSVGISDFLIFRRNYGRSGDL